MLAGKSSKVHSSSESQTKSTQQPFQQPDLQHLSLVIEQFSSQLNLMLSQQQQQKHSDSGVTRNADNKQEQPFYFQHQQQTYCPVNASRFTPLHSNCCNNIVGSCSKIGNLPHCHSQSAYLSPSLSSLLPSQQHQYTSPCLHGQLHQNYHQHPYGFDAVPPPSCVLPMICHCNSTPYQCTTTTNNTILPPINDSASSCTPTNATADDHRRNSHHHSNTPTHTPATISIAPDPCADTTCTPPATYPRFKSRTDPLPPIPNDDSPNDDDNDDDGVDTDDDDKAAMMNGQNNPAASSLSSPMSPAAATGIVPNCDMSSPNAQEQQHGQISWTDLYRQDILAKQGILASSSSYNNLDNIILNNDISNDGKDEYKSKSSRSHRRGLWSLGKYKWKQLRKKSVSPLFVPG